MRYTGSRQRLPKTLMGAAFLWEPQERSEERIGNEVYWLTAEAAKTFVREPPSEGSRLGVRVPLRRTDLSVSVRSYSFK